jgi:hypothetical protein
MRALRAFILSALFAACGKIAPEPETTTPPPAIPLVAWVTDLANQTTDDAIPDTVEDKNIADTDDTAAFDAFLD